MPNLRSRTAIVIGAGIGGIAAATHLARHGWRVTVLEKNRGPGGRCGRYSHDGHHFDTGPTLFLLPFLYEAEFAALGTSLSELLDLRRVDPTYHLVFDDGRRLALSSDVSYMRSQLEEFEPGSFQGLLRYLDEGARHYRLAVPKLVNRDFRRAREFFSLENLPLLWRIKALVPHYANMAAYFDRPRLKSAFTFQDAYMGLSPFEAPATFSMMAYTEIAHGVWYPRGGMYRIVEALMEIAHQAGVEFAFDTPVARIDVEDASARGVTLSDGRRLPADIVIANADLPYVYNALLPDSDLAERMERKRFSCSVVSFYWAVDKTYPALAPHTLFLADDYRQNFDAISRGTTLPENPSLYVHAPARIDPGMAPAGQDTLIAVVPVGHLRPDNAWDGQDYCAWARRHVLRRLATLGITDLEAHLKFELSWSPNDWLGYYNLMKGATHGLSHNLTQLGYMRPRNRHPRYRNLYFVGASTHPGTGIPTVLVSARHVARRVLDDHETAA